ncbi:MAG: response regulator transcription factor [Christensenellales bacterium]|jgi:two-component system alkaline phosphatase synthesis response regulator PhoP
MNECVCIVEDDENIRELMRYALHSSGYKVCGFESGEAFFEAAAELKPNLLLLDIMLPGLSGYDVLRRVRQDEKMRDMPVIFITAKGTEVDKVHGFEIGADDYIVKPFGVMELIARVKAVLRRGGSRLAGTTLEYKDLSLDTDSRKVTISNEKTELTLKEYELLRCLLENRGRVLSREQLLEKVWGYDFEGETRTVDMHVKTLRRKLGDEPSRPIYIQTVRGIGYKLGD